jgi:uncharacterized protein (TIGR02646 family)
MRYIKRDPNFAPESLKIPGGKGEVEKNNIIKHYSKAGVEKFDKFTAYKLPDVQLAIKSQFNDKCAYCESSYAAVSPADIEHYRPKGSVTGESKHIGYWWLAGVWENLLASCPDCNRRRYQESVDLTETTTTKSKPQLSGKADHFPILGVRAMCESDNHLLEDPLLIDPTVTNPSNHLVFTTDTMISVILPINQNGLNDAYGDESIKTFGLNRVGLVDSRTAFLQNLKLISEMIDELFSFAVQPGMTEENTNKLIASANENLKRLAEYANPNKTYSALAATFYDQILEKMKRKYQNVLK